MRKSLAIFTLLICGVVYAQEDVAPIPDDVIQEITKVYRGNNAGDELVAAVNHQHEATGALIEQILADTKNSHGFEQASLWATKKALLVAQVNTLDVLKSAIKERQKGLNSKGGTASDTLFAGNWRVVLQRLEKLQATLGEIKDASTAGQRMTALTKAANSFARARDARQADDSRIPSGPGFSTQEPFAGPMEHGNASLPMYMTQNGVLGSTYALLDTGSLIDAAPPVLAVEASTCNSTAADLPAITDVEIKALAAKLNFSPAKIFEYVSNEIKFEPYYGLLKGPRTTLQSKAGGPMDQSALLVSLLQASNVPARFLRGNVRMRSSAISNWLGTANSAVAAMAVLEKGGTPVAASTTRGAETDVNFEHVWVEACVPYSNYRGIGVERQGYRWVPLDPSFETNTNIQAGINTAVTFPYDSYLATRTNALPTEVFESTVEASIKGLAPYYANNRLADVRYGGLRDPLKVDVLPVSLPYEVVGFLNWAGTTSPEVATLPDVYKYSLVVTVNNEVKTFVYPDIVDKRLTLSFVGASTAAVDALWSWRTGVTATLPCPTTGTSGLLSRATLMVDGVPKWAATNTVDVCTKNNNVKFELKVQKIAGLVTVNSADFAGKISAADYYAFTIYGYQTSVELLNEKVARLARAASNSPDANSMDATLGAYLDVVGLKYVRYVADANKRIGNLSYESGVSGNHMGLVSTKSKITYVQGQPFGLTAEGLLVDFPGVKWRSVGLNSGNLGGEAFKAGTYAASALEHYVWQENARMDAVSTIRGLQFAREKGGTVVVLPPTWNKVTPSLSAYSTAEINAIWNLTQTGYTVTIPTAKITYVNWIGTVYFAEKITPTTGSIIAAISGGYSGGYAVGPPVSYSYDNTLKSGNKLLVPAENLPGGTNIFDGLGKNDPPPYLNSFVGNGAGKSMVFSGDPVNLATGNMYHTERDLKIKGRGGLDFTFERHYNSRDVHDGPLGFGWTHNFNQFLMLNDANTNGVIDAKDSDGVISSVTWQNSTGAKIFMDRWEFDGGTFPTFLLQPRGGSNFVLDLSQTEGYKITEVNGISYKFESPVGGTVGKKLWLTEISDAYNNKLRLAYVGADHCLSTVTDDLGRALTFTCYPGTNRIKTMTDWSNRVYTYEYDANNNLVTYKSPLAGQAPTQYTYYTAADGKALNHSMEAYFPPRGNAVVFEYYLDGRTFRHFNGLGEGQSFTYNTFRRETVVTNERGFEHHYFFNENGMLVKEIDAERNVLEYGYDADFFTRMTSKTDALGQKTFYYWALAAVDTLSIVVEPSGAGPKYAYPRFNGDPQRIVDANGSARAIEYPDNWYTRPKSVNVFKSGVEPDPFAPVNESKLVKREEFARDSYGNITDIWYSRLDGSTTRPHVIFDYNDTVNNTIGLNPVKVTRCGDDDANPLTAEKCTSYTQSFDSLGRLKSSVNAAWYPVNFEYDNLDRVIRSTDANGKLRDFAFDNNGNAISQKLLNASSVVLDQSSNSYDLADRRSQTTSFSGAKTLFEYDAAGNLTRTTNPEGYAAGLQYNALNHWVIAYDEEGRSVSRATDTLGRTRRITDPNGNVEEFVYYDATKNGRLKQKSVWLDAAGATKITTEYDYDNNGNVISVTEKGAGSGTNNTLMSYDVLNRLVRTVGPIVTNELGAKVRPVTTYTYNGLGYRTAVSAGWTTTLSGALGADVLTKQMGYVYDDFGRLWEQSDALGQKWVVDIMDEHGNPTTSHDAKGQKIVREYEYGGVLKKESAYKTVSDTVPEHVTEYLRNDLGQVKSVTSNEVNFTYGYDTANRLKSVLDSRANKSIGFEYSVSGRVNRMTESDGRATQYLYDPAGRLTGVWAPNNEMATYIYDDGGRILEKWFTNGVNTRYTYNGDNTLAKMVNQVFYPATGGATAISSHTYKYDEFGFRKNDVSVIGGVSKDYLYDFDALHRLTKVSDQTLSTITPVVESYTYDAYNNRRTRTAAGAVSYYQYDDAQRLKDYLYDFDALHRLTKVSDQTLSTITPVVESYTYDAYNNRRTRTAAGAVSYYQYDDAQRLKDIRSGSATGPVLTSFEYDSNNNQYKKTEGALTSTSVFDALDRLVQVTQVNGAATSVETYTYGPSGQRLSKTAGGVTKNYLYNGPDILAEYGAGWGTALATYTHGPFVDDPIERVAGATTRFFQQDGLGSVVAMTDSLGAASGTQRFDVWGNRIANAGTIDQFGYTGREPDATGFVYFRARYYDPTNGRFTQTDPLGFVDGINRFTYAMNNPANYNDPWGTSVQIPCAAASCHVQGYSPGPMLPEATQRAAGYAVAATALTGMVSGPAAGLFNLYNAAMSDVPMLPGSSASGSLAAKVQGNVAKGADGFVDLTSAQRRTHILDGDATGGGHRPGTGLPGKSEFPQGWSDNKIMHEISDIATDPAAVTRAGRGGRTITEGTRGGIDIRIIQERNGDIVSGFPTNVPRNPK